MEINRTFTGPYLRLKTLFSKNTPGQHTAQGFGKRRSLKLKKIPMGYFLFIACFTNGVERG